MPPTSPTFQNATLRLGRCGHTFSRLLKSCPVCGKDASVGKAAARNAASKTSPPSKAPGAVTSAKTGASPKTKHGTQAPRRVRTPAPGSMRAVTTGCPLCRDAEGQASIRVDLRVLTDGRAVPTSERAAGCCENCAARLVERRRLAGVLALVPGAPLLLLAALGQTLAAAIGAALYALYLVLRRGYTWADAAAYGSRLEDALLGRFPQRAPGTSLLFPLEAAPAMLRLRSTLTVLVVGLALSVSGGTLVRWRLEMNEASRTAIASATEAATEETVVVAAEPELEPAVVVPDEKLAVAPTPIPEVARAEEAPAVASVRSAPPAISVDATAEGAFVISLSDDCVLVTFAAAPAAPIWLATR